MGTNLIDVLELETRGEDVFRGEPFTEEAALTLYGGQVAARALWAAGQTVAPGRVPHSLHGYYLRGGDPSKPTDFRVDRDRDGGTYSARRVVALQDGEVIFSMATSFVQPVDGPDHQMVNPVPLTPPPEDGSAAPTGAVLFSIETREADQPNGPTRWPTRFWVRCTEAIGSDPLLQACVLTYLSDASTGLAGVPVISTYGPTIDHAVWFHRPANLETWHLLDLVPLTVASRRGLYTGSVLAIDGTVVASLAQEALFRT